MSKLKTMPGVAWLVIGVCVTALVMPTAAFAAGALKFTGIEGTSSNKADVSSVGQVLTAAASPANYYTEANVALIGGAQVVGAPPSGDGLIVTSIQTDVFQDPTPGVAQNVDFYIGNTSCSFVGPFSKFLNPAGIGEIDLQFNPGLVVPNGDALCAIPSGSVLAEANAVGYTAPSSEVPAVAGPAQAPPPAQP
ncbi:MAG: hypothetical protein JO368_06130 [Acidimicrobiales bacterium]|nr:hypothetical protein [Acidimicrobiales bacterium]